MAKLAVCQESVSLVVARLGSFSRKNFAKFWPSCGLDRRLFKNLSIMWFNSGFDPLLGELELLSKDEFGFLLFFD